MHRLAALLLVCVGVAMHSVSAGRLPRDLFDASADETELLDTINLGTLGGFGNIISFVKFQFRDIIEEICIHALKYLKEILLHYKVSLLKKLGKYTLSDIFHAVFDGVTDFVVESSSDLQNDSETISEALQSGYGYYPTQWREVQEKYE